MELLDAAQKKVDRVEKNFQPPASSPSASATTSCSISGPTAAKR
jgi:hypothetical protein